MLQFYSYSDFQTKNLHTHLDVSVAALILKNVAFASLATALAYRQKS